MSVIYGLCNLQHLPVSLSQLQTIEQTLNHWSADRTRNWIGATTGFGHLMLYNTPESLHEYLPFYESHSGLAITADARIDNREQIIIRLGLEKQLAKTFPDSLLILHLYARYGEDCVNYLIGDFAFAVWDEKNQKLFCARDHLGVKPFFYYHDSKIFSFASEKKGILCIEGINDSLDMEFFYRSLLFQPVHYPDTTLFKHIKRLPPAHCLSLSSTAGVLRIRRYWEPDIHTEIRFPSKGDYYEALLAHFREAVQCRLRSTFPVGAELSGGIDSSSIVGVASHLLKKENKKIITLSHVLPPSVSDPSLLEKEERKYIEEVLRFNAITDHEYISSIGFDSFTEEADFALAINDGVDVLPGIGLTQLKKQAQIRGIRTTLSGFPGDEMVTFRGNSFLLDFLDKKQYGKFLRTSTSEGIRHKVALLLPYPAVLAFNQFKTAFGFHSFKVATALKIFNIPRKYKTKLNDPLWLNPYYANRFKSYRHYQAARLLYPHVGFRMETETRVSTHFRMESRYPMADIRLAQFCLSMPNAMKYEGGISRYTFLKSLGSFLPELVAKRNNKNGAVSPFRILLRQQQFAEASHIALKIKGSGILNPKLNILQLNKDHVDDFTSIEQQLMVKLDVLRWIEKQTDRLPHR